jgi:hypothetical protein
MKIQIHSEQELIKVAEEAIRVIANLRKFTKLWEETYGADLRNRKKCWEELADKFVEQLQVELRTNEQIKIELKPQQ